MCQWRSDNGCVSYTDCAHLYLCSRSHQQEKPYSTFCVQATFRTVKGRQAVQHFVHVQCQCVLFSLINVRWNHLKRIWKPHVWQFTRTLCKIWFQIKQLHLVKLNSYFWCFALRGNFTLTYKQKTSCSSMQLYTLIFLYFMKCKVFVLQKSLYSETDESHQTDNCAFL